jgi:hypothetical protein
VKKKIFISLVIYLLFFFSPMALRTVIAVGEDCSYQPCSDTKLTCTKTGQTKLIKCYHFYWGATYIKVNKSEDLGEIACVDSQTGNYKKLNEPCNNGVGTGECKFARKPCCSFTGEPDETWEVRDVKTCLDNNPLTITQPTSEQISKAKNLKNCYVDPAGGSTTNPYHIVVQDGDELAKWVFVQTNNNNLIYSLGYPKKISGKISTSVNMTEGTYSVTGYGYDDKGTLKQYCTTPNYTFTGTTPPSHNFQCKVSVPEPKNGSIYENGEKIIINATGLEKSPDASGNKIVYQVSAQPVWDSKDFETDSIGTLSVPIEVQGSPTVIIMKNGQQVCPELYLTNTETYQDDQITTSPDADPPPCANTDPTTHMCTSVSTGLGIDFGTDAAGFVQSIFGLILGLAGGIALLLIMVSGYRLMFARGNPEKMQHVKESLTSAVVGLLFIIFSLVILEVIGVNILKLPGFGQ